MKRLQILIVIIIVIVAAVALWFHNGLLPVNMLDKTQKNFIVPKGVGLRAIANNLHDEGLIRDPIVFFLEVKKLGLDSTIQAGNFRLSPSMDTDAIIKA